MSNKELNPMQQGVVEVLGKPAGWVPLPLTVVAAVREQLEAFAVFAQADELMVCHQAPSIEERLRSVELTAEAMQLASV
jgi:hypothetical protein